MRIGTITFNGAHNNGALLQAYALQKYLEKLGHEVSVINYRLPEIAKSYRLIKYRKRNFYLHDRLVYGIKYIKLLFKEGYKFAKRDKFESFINNKLNITKECKDLNDIRDAHFDFDALICGSDQIWNYNLTKGLKPAFFLDFGKKCAKRISYAASIGVEIIPNEYKEVYQRYLSNLDYISVREESAKKLLSSLTKKNIEVVLDPTLLLDAKDYENICINPKYDVEYIYYHQIAEDDQMVKLAEFVSKHLNLKIITNLNKKLFKNELDRVPSVDPGEFLGLIKNAKFVITNSFHATVFSVIYKKMFFTVPHPKYPVRMVNLLTMLEHEHLLISKIDDDFDLDKIKFDYEKIIKTLNNARKLSYDFLEKALNSKEVNYVHDKYFDSENKFSCYGCTACKNICPTEAISMVNDREGFAYPKVDNDKCIKCGQCEKVCIYRKFELFNDLNMQKVYAAKNKENVILQKSTSGGVFSAMCEHILKTNGYIFGVEFDKNLNVVYNYYNNKDYEKFRGAKYVRADIGDIFGKVKEFLKNGTLVLFSGTPCVVAGLKSYLNKDYDNLYLVDIVCHSNSSPKVFKEYMQMLEREEKSKINNFNFRSKNIGWRNSIVSIKFDNNNSINESVYTNNYTANFLLGNMSRPCCYNCEFAYQSRVGDVSIGDYWGIGPEFDNNSGTSVVMVNNEKGNHLFENIKESLEYIETPSEQALLKNHNAPITLDTRRYNFYKSLDENEKLIDTLEKFNTRSGENYVGFGNFLPIFYKTKNYLCIFSLCVYKSKIKNFVINKDECKYWLLFKNGIPFFKGFKLNLYKLKIPLKNIGNFNIQNKIFVGMSTKKIPYNKHGIGYDLINLRKGKNRNSRIFKITNDTVAYFRQSAKNGLYLTVREFHKTDKRSFQTKIFFAKLISFFCIKKDIILLFEKESSRYEESASVLYEKLIDLGYTNVYYILDKNYPYMKDIDSRYTKKIIKRLSLKHFVYFFICNKFISTESLGHAVDLRIANRHIVNKLQSKKNKYVFLQHGVMYMVSLDSELKKKANVDDKTFYKVVVSSKLEAEHFIKLGGYNPEDIYICGLAKYDRNIRYDNADKIVVMLTWRRWEYNSVRVNFENTKYFKFLERIIYNIPEKYKDKIIILPHPLFLKLIQNSDSKLMNYMPKGDFRYDEILRNTKLLITDYSSISYDAFYRGSNVIFCWEEKDECFIQYGGSSKLMLNENNCFGDVCYDTKELKSLVEKNYNFSQRDEYIKNYRKIVEFNDGKNTERLIELLKKDKII